MNNNLTEAVRNTGKAIFNKLSNAVHLTIRQLAAEVGTSKSSAHRQLHSITARNQYPESSFWETEEGAQWLRYLFVAVLLKFGVECGVGAGKISEFFQLARVHTHIGSSPDAILKKLRETERWLIQFQAEFEKQHSGIKREVIVASDEVFFNKMLVMVMMDLPSGYLLFEETVEDRSFETWLKNAQPRLQKMGVVVIHSISDRAKALIKLATDGFDCLPGADLFHVQYDVTKWLGSTFKRREQQAEKMIEKKVNHLIKIVKNNETEVAISAAERELQGLEQEYLSVEQGRKDYRDANLELSQIVHPFCTENGKPQDSRQTENRLVKTLKSLKAISFRHGIQDNKGVLKKIHRQLKDLSSGVDVWWLYVLRELVITRVEFTKQKWILYSLLPVVYWHGQMKKTQNSTQKNNYKAMWEEAHVAWQVHPLTAKISEEENEKWSRWAEGMVGRFHRSSSQVEGRNGVLSQLHHNGKGLTSNRLKANGVIHNFGKKRADQTTAAERLYGVKPPDIFESLVEQIGPLPLPRKGRKRVHHNPLECHFVPA